MKRYSLHRLLGPIASTIAILPLACSSDAPSDIDTMRSALEADPSCTASTYEAETMFHSTGGPTTGGWNIWSDGYISTTHDFEGGTTQVTAVVKGQFAGGAAANMRITVDGVTVHSTAVGSSSWTPYNFTFEAPGGEHEIRIYFTNDYYKNGQDRNLYVDKLIVGCGTGLCGNGRVDPGEACDDGNQTSNDSCTMECTFNACGDGELYTLLTDTTNPNALEECDDANDDNSDACTNQCSIAVCGDSIVAVDEECDDGNTIDDDACSNTCIANAGPICGDGNTDGDEECDDGNTSDDDSCTNECALNVCGDGFPLLVITVEAAPNPVEECDDGNDVDADACSNTCTINVVPVCGDGNIDDGEECDDANDVDTDSCTSDCTFNSCGDGFAYESVTDESNPNPLEECDDGNTSDDDACSNTCTINVGPVCGDGNTDGDEECDDGNTSDDDSCTNECALNVCGDGFPLLVITVEAAPNPVEECDDGNDVDADACSNTCTINVVPVCGDGNIDDGEECDDANDVDTDSCTSDCTFNSCGDGFAYESVTDESNPNPLEECDDGNDTAGDGCDAMCAVEPEAGASGNLTFTNQWPGGYCVTLNVSNDAAQATTSWSAVVDTHGAIIYTQWSANFSGNSGEVGLSSLFWNAVIAPGATNSSAGFCANRTPGTPAPEVVSVQGAY